jgi:hypothetical protein
MIARLIQPHMQQRLGRTVIIENRSGGGGTALRRSQSRRRMAAPGPARLLPSQVGSGEMRVRALAMVLAMALVAAPSMHCGCPGATGLGSSKTICRAGIELDEFFLGHFFVPSDCRPSIRG